MKTKREVLEEYVKSASCGAIQCDECGYRNKCFQGEGIHNSLVKIGAITVLRRDRNFNTRNVLTAVTADKAKIGMRGYFADTMATLREEFAQKNVQTLTRVFSKDTCESFEADNYASWILFYPIDEFEV